MTDKPEIQVELEKLGWSFNPAAEPPYTWTKAPPGLHYRSLRLIGQDSPDWVQDVATAQVNILMNHKP